MLDSTVETAWLVALTMPISVATIMAASFSPLALGAIPMAVVAYRRGLPAMILVALVLSPGALGVWIGMNLS